MQLKKLSIMLIACVMLASIISTTPAYADEAAADNQNRYMLITQQVMKDASQGEVFVEVSLQLDKVNSENIAAYQFEIQAVAASGEALADIEELEFEFDSGLNEKDIHQAIIDKENGLIQLYVATTKNLVSIQEENHVLKLGTVKLRTKETTEYKVVVSGNNGQLKTVNQDLKASDDLGDTIIISDGTIIKSDSKVDYSELQKAIEDAQKYVADNQYTEQNTTTASFQKYLQTLNAAKEMIESSDSQVHTQEEIDQMVDLLNQAVLGLEKLPGEEETTTNQQETTNPGDSNGSAAQETTSGQNNGTDQGNGNQEETTNAKKPAENVKPTGTGDSAKIKLLLTVCAVSGVIVVSLVVNKKRHQVNK